MKKTNKLQNKILEPIIYHRGCKLVINLEIEEKIKTKKPFSNRT